MWPMYVDYTDDECKKILRSLELEAYSSIVTAFRAQGTLTKDKKRMLLEFCSALSISMERHRAEIRRAVNDEHLNTIAERLFGPNTATDWAIEGRRVVPLISRCTPHTVFTEIANSAATAQAAKNASLPLPGKTGSREMSNGTETMASRKRKDCASDSSVSPQKMSALDSQYFHNLLPHDNSSSGIPEPMQVPEVSMSSENFQTTETTPQISTPVTDLNASRNVPPVVTHSISAVATTKSSSKHPILKSSSTVTTFSSFDQITSNLIASRGVTQAPVPVTAHDEQVPPASEVAKPPSEVKSTQRPLSSISSVKSSTIVIPTTVPSTCSASSSKDRLSTSSSTSHSKFLSQIRSSKTPGHTRQNLPAGLGIKLTPQPQMSQRATVSPKSPSIKVKQDSSNIFNKKTSTNVYPSPISDNQLSQFPIPTSCDTITLSKSTLSIPKLNSKSESQTATNQQSTAKQTTVSKNLPKTTVTTTTPPSTTTHTSQYISRSLFSTSSKSGAKSLSPMIFNVATTCCTALQTATKSTGPTQSEAGKHSPQLLPKSTAVGINPSHLKINTSNTQTIQYRNDGGLVRSARIVNISQPVGSRLPCAISSSAISALGLSTNISSTALRVTLPAGTLNTTNSIRVSSAAKPNVIVVHKAQMWPRAPQGAAVIMSSAPLTKISNEIVQETLSITQKQDKSKTSNVKTIPRAIAPARPQSPAVSITSIKASEANSTPNPSTVTAAQSDSSSSETRNTKPIENTSEAQCKRNLLADIIEASGILLENNSLDKSSKDKSDVKNNKEIVSLSNHQELEITVSQKSPISSSITSDATHNKSSDSNTSKGDNANSRESTLTVTPVDRNGKEVTKHISLPAETQSKESGIIAVSSSHSSTNENITSSKESGSKAQKEVSKEKDL